MKKRILFLMSDTGGGHRAAAQAIEEAIHLLYPDVYETYIEDFWKDHTRWPFNTIPNAYAWLTGPGRPLWKFLWLGSSRLQAHKLVLPGLTPVLEGKAIRYLNEVRPNIVVSVHPVMNHLGLKWLNKARLNIPLITVVTDLISIHPLWICPQVARCLVPTQAAADMAVKFGMPPEKLDICGQPISLKFAVKRPGAKRTARLQLGLAMDRRVVLVLGGGEGFGPVFDIARTLAQAASQAQLIVVAGRNQALRERLEAITWEIPTRIYGFVDNMPELMKAADILITKAGPNTISEAFAAGLPPLIFGYIPGQEWGNVTYVQQHQAGAYAAAPSEIAKVVLDWLDPANPTLSIMARNAFELARPEAALLIAGQVCNLIRDHGQTESLRHPKSPLTKVANRAIFGLFPK